MVVAQQVLVAGAAVAVVGTAAYYGYTTMLDRQAVEAEDQRVAEAQERIMLRAALREESTAHGSSTSSNQDSGEYVRKHMRAHDLLLAALKDLSVQLSVGLSSVSSFQLPGAESRTSVLACVVAMWGDSELMDELITMPRMFYLTTGASPPGALLDMRQLMKFGGTLPRMTSSSASIVYPWLERLETFSGPTPQNPRLISDWDALADALPPDALQALLHRLTIHVADATGPRIVTLLTLPSRYSWGLEALTATLGLRTIPLHELALQFGRHTYGPRVLLQSHSNLSVKMKRKWVYSSYCAEDVFVVTFGFDPSLGFELPELPDQQVDWTAQVEPRAAAMFDPMELAQARAHTANGWVELAARFEIRAVAKCLRGRIGPTEKALHGATLAHCSALSGVYSPDGDDLEELHEDQLYRLDDPVSRVTLFKSVQRDLEQLVPAEGEGEAVVAALQREVAQFASVYVPLMHAKYLTAPLTEGGETPLSMCGKKELKYEAMGNMWHDMSRSDSLRISIKKAQVRRDNRMRQLVSIPSWWTPLCLLLSFVTLTAVFSLFVRSYFPWTPSLVLMACDYGMAVINAIGLWRWWLSVPEAVPSWYVWLVERTRAAGIHNVAGMEQRVAATWGRWCMRMAAEAMRSAVARGSISMEEALRLMDSMAEAASNMAGGHDVVLPGPVEQVEAWLALPCTMDTPVDHPTLRLTFVEPPKPHPHVPPQPHGNPPAENNHAATHDHHPVHMDKPVHRQGAKAKAAGARARRQAAQAATRAQQAAETDTDVNAQKTAQTDTDVNAQQTAQTDADVVNAHRQASVPAGSDALQLSTATALPPGIAPPLRKGDRGSRKLSDVIAENGWVIIRDKRHYIVRRIVSDARGFVRKQTVTLAKTPSDYRANKNALAVFNRRDTELL